MLSEYFTRVQLSGLVALGGLFWGAAALKIRHTGHILYANDVRRWATFAASIPVGQGMILISESLLRISSKYRLQSTAVMAATALMMDGVAFMWFPSIYENPVLQKHNHHLAITASRMGAAWLLWGVGVSLGCALLS